MKLKSAVVSIWIIILFIVTFTLAVDVSEILIKMMNREKVMVIKGGVLQ